MARGEKRRERLMKKEKIVKENKREYKKEKQS